ncbi:hypothetical protein [Streptomyces sp. SGAir0957]
MGQGHTPDSASAHADGAGGGRRRRPGRHRSSSGRGTGGERPGRLRPTADRRPPTGTATASAAVAAKTAVAADGRRIGPTATGHAGYSLGALTPRAATPHHADASGGQVTLRVRLTDSRGNSVTPTVARAYDVR